MKNVGDSKILTLLAVLFFILSTFVSPVSSISNVATHLKYCAPSQKFLSNIHGFVSSEFNFFFSFSFPSGLN